MTRSLHIVLLFTDYIFVRAHTEEQGALMAFSKAHIWFASMSRFYLSSPFHLTKTTRLGHSMSIRSCYLFTFCGTCVSIIPDFSCLTHRPRPRGMGNVCLATATTIKNYLASNGLGQLSFDQSASSVFPMTTPEIQIARMQLRSDKDTI
jgi:hypothetical protein